MLLLRSSEYQIKHQGKPLALQNLVQADKLLLVQWFPSVPDGTPASPWSHCRLESLQVLPLWWEHLEQQWRCVMQAASGPLSFLFSLSKTSLSLEPDWLPGVVASLKISPASSGCLMLETMVSQKCMLLPACCPWQTVRHNLLSLLPCELQVRLVWPQECLLDAVRWPQLSHASEMRQLCCGCLLAYMVWAAVRPTRWKGLLLAGVTNYSAILYLEYGDPPSLWHGSSVGLRGSFIMM